MSDPVYLDHAAVAPLSQPAAETMGVWLQQAADDGVTTWADWSRKLSQTRQAAAQLIGADEDEIALVSNTTGGLTRSRPRKSPRQALFNS